ncbi:MAG TPA: hypothetical protein VFG86_06685 [Chloroflexota bacterium]|nr:hypothetical protein [Chloroflexota bacterium]
MAACVLLEVVLLPIGLDDLDDGYFAQQAMRIVHGQIPYRDFESLYTPGLAYVHSALFSVLGGPFMLAPRVLSLAFRVTLAALLYVLARPLVRQPLWAALPSAVVLLGFDAAPTRWEPHPGWPSTVLCVLTAWCAAHSGSRRWLIGSGLAAGAAYAFKQNAGALILLALVLHFRRRAPLPLLGFAAITLMWLVPLTVAIDGRVERLAPFVGAVNQAGLASPPEPTVAIPVACLIGGILCRGDRRERWYLLAGACLLATQYPRADTVHLAWSAPLLLVVGASVLSRLRLPYALGLLGAAVILCLPSLRVRFDSVRQASTTLIGVPYANGLRAPAETWADLINIVAEIQKRTVAGEPIFVYPTSPLLYVLAERPNPTRFDHLNPGAATATQIEQTIATLDSENVKLVVESAFWQAAWGPPGNNVPLEAWLDARFHEVARFGPYSIRVRDQ